MSAERMIPSANKRRGSTSDISIPDDMTTSTCDSASVTSSMSKTTHCHPLLTVDTSGYDNAKRPTRPAARRCMSMDMMPRRNNQRRGSGSWTEQVARYYPGPTSEQDEQTELERELVELKLEFAKAKATADEHRLRASKLTKQNERLLAENKALRENIESVEVHANDEIHHLRSLLATNVAWSADDKSKKSAVSAAKKAAKARLEKEKEETRKEELKHTIRAVREAELRLENQNISNERDQILAELKRTKKERDDIVKERDEMKLRLSSMVTVETRPEGLKDGILGLLSNATQPRRGSTIRTESVRSSLCTSMRSNVSERNVVTTESLLWDSD